MLWVLKRTISMRRFLSTQNIRCNIWIKNINIITLNFCLDVDLCMCLFQSHDHSKCIRPVLPKYDVIKQTVTLKLNGSFVSDCFSPKRERYREH